MHLAMSSAECWSNVLTFFCCVGCCWYHCHYSVEFHLGSQVLVHPPISLTIYNHNSNPMEFVYHYSWISDHTVATYFAHAPIMQICNDNYVVIWIITKQNFKHIWVLSRKLLVTWAIGPISQIADEAHYPNLVKLLFVFTWKIMVQSGQKFAHATTTELS